MFTSLFGEELGRRFLVDGLHAAEKDSRGFVNFRPSNVFGSNSPPLRFQTKVINIGMMTYEQILQLLVSFKPHISFNFTMINLLFRLVSFWCYADTSSLNRTTSEKSAEHKWTNLCTESFQSAPSSSSCVMLTSTLISPLTPLVTSALTALSEPTRRTKPLPSF